MDDPSARPRLLFICQLNPWRLNNGGIIRNYWLLHALAQWFVIDLVTGDDAGDTIPADFRAQCAEIYCFPRPKGLLAKVVRALGALRFDRSYYTSGTVTAQMRTTVARLTAARTYSAVMTDLCCIDAVPGEILPIVYSSHNCESALLLRRAKLEPPWSRLAMTIDALRVRRLEARLIDRSIVVTPCSANDMRDMAAFAPSISGKAVVIPNGVDCATYRDVAKTEGTGRVILVTGSFDWLPNRRGLLWFLDDVLPVLDKLLAGREFSVRVAGRMTAEFAKKLSEFPHVTAVPNVPRMDVELRAATLVAVPVIASSGTRLRILEAWAAGRPIVTTPHGAFGLDHSDGSDLFACSSAQKFAEAAATLLDDGGLRAKLRAGGLVRAAAYDWSAVGTKLIDALEHAGMLPALARELRPLSANS